MPKKLQQLQGESDEAFAKRQETQREKNRIYQQTHRNKNKAQKKKNKRREQLRAAQQRFRDKEKKEKQEAELAADDVVTNLEELEETQASTIVDDTDIPSTFEAELAADDVVTNLEELDETQASTIVDDTDIPDTSMANLAASDTSMARSVEQLSGNHDNRLAMVATRHGTAVAGNSSGHYLAVGNSIHPHLHPYQLAEKIENIENVQIFNISGGTGTTINCGTSGITREDVQQMIDRRLAGNVQVNYNYGTVNQYSGTSGIALTREDVQQMIDRRAEDVIQTVQSSAAKKFDELTETQAEQAIVVNDTKNAVDQHTNVMNENQAKQEKKVDELIENQAVQRKELNQLTEMQAEQAIVVNNTKNAVNHNARNARVRHKVLKQTRDVVSHNAKVLRDDVNYLHERIDDTNECLASHRAWIDNVREGFAKIKTKRPERSIHKNKEKENNV